MTILTPQALLNLKKFRKKGPKDKSRNPNPKTPTMMGEEKKSVRDIEYAERIKKFINKKKKGGLSEGQKKLDKNNNNRIDAEDFKILRGGKKKGGMFRGYNKVFATAAGPGSTGTSTIVGVKPNPKKSLAKSKRKTFKSMEEMRKAKGFKPGETASQFNKRRAALATAKQAAKATTLGKIVLPIAAAGVAASQYLKSKMKKKKEEPKKKMGGGMMQRPMSYKTGGPTAPSRRKAKRRQGVGSLLGGVGSGLGRQAGRAARSPQTRKEDSSVTLGKFMKAKVDALNESVKAGGMKRDRILEGSNMRSPRRFIRDVEEGKYSKPSKDAAYYKSIGLTGARGDKAVDNFFKPRNLKMKVGGSVKAKCKLGRNKPTKMY